jgi:DNA modification methylase
VSVVILRGDAASLPVADESVDLIVTSPPYWGLRSYSDNGGHYDGQIGSEETPREYVAALLDCTREWLRVLKPEGSLFVNLGDKYAERSGPGHSAGTEGRLASRPERPRRKGPADTGVRPKSLIGLPWRYALGCVDDLGLILRAEVVWDKPNGLPESVTDRVRRSHEQVFHFTKQSRYFAAVDEIREPHTMRPQRRPGGRPEDLTPRQGQLRQAWSTARRDEAGVDGHPLGKLPGSVWEIPSQPLSVPAHLGVDHFAAFPMELPRRVILGWSPSGICAECGEGRRPVTETAGYARLDRPRLSHDRPGSRADRNPGNNRRDSALPYGSSATRLAAITGYACACPQPDAPTRPAIVVDPFSGTGTTALVASAYGRIGIGIDRSADYCRLARWRASDPAERAKAMCVPKPPPVPEGQGSLFDGIGEATAS